MCRRAQALTNDARAGQNICSGVIYISLLLPWSTNVTRRERRRKRRSQQLLRSQIQSKSGFRQLSGADPALAMSKTLNPALILKVQMKGIPSLRPLVCTLILAKYVMQSMRYWEWDTRWLRGYLMFSGAKRHTCMRTMIHRRDSGTSVPLAMDHL